MPKIAHTVLRALPPLAGFVLASFGAASVGGVATSRSVNTWYRTLRRPEWTPPDSVFGPVWTVLYVLIAVSPWMIWRTSRQMPEHRDHARDALTAWSIQLALNALWSIVFFGMRQIFGGLWVIVALWATIATYVALATRVSRLAGLLLLPYLAWTTFAGLLNARIWQLNRGRD